MSKQPNIPSPGAAAAAGIQTDTELSPFKYLIDAASTLGKKIKIGDKEYDFTGLGQTDTARKISDQMAQTLLDLQKEKSPEIIKQRIEELKAADPQGYAARQQLFDKIIAQADSNPGRPVNSDLQQSLQDELAKGTGFSDDKEAEQVREQSRGGQVRNGIFLGNAPAASEAKNVVNAGESLRNQRQQNALNLLESGASPEDVAYRKMQQTLGNLSSFQQGTTPEAQFGQVSASRSGPVQLTGGAPNAGQFNPSAGAQGQSNALSLFGAQSTQAANSANPWLAGLSLGANALSTINNINSVQQPQSNNVYDPNYQWGR